MLNPERYWECPSCARQHVSHEPRPHTPLHACTGQAGLAVPFVPVKTNGGIKRGTVRHKIVEREDYIGQEKGVRLDSNGKAVMAVHTERANGHDTHVFPGTAVGTTEQ